MGRRVGLERLIHKKYNKYKIENVGDYDSS